MTEYLVLERTGPLDKETYDVIGRAEAHGPVQAIKALTAKRDLPEDDVAELFAAVPVRNWTGVSKKVKRSEPVVSYTELPTISAEPVAMEPDEPAADDEAGLTLVDPDPDPDPDPDADAEPEDDEPAAATA